MTSMTTTETTKRSAKQAPRSVAFITIGRWEPPHQGHEVIGTRTIDYSRMYNRERGFNAFSSKDNPAVPIMWISPVGDHGIPTDKRNPLTTLQRLYYLKRIFPRTKYPDLEFLTDLKNIGLGFEELLNTGDNSGLTEDRNRKKKPKNWDEMTPCQKYKYTNIMAWKPAKQGRRWNNKIYPTRKAGLDSDDLEYRLPSKQCLHFLAKHRYKQVSIVVGSDRAAAFEKYNRKDFDLLFPGRGDVVEEGGERGEAGKGKSRESKTSSSAKEEKRVISCKSNLIQISIKREKSDDEKALSHRNSPFKNIDTLLNYLLDLLKNKINA